MADTINRNPFVIPDEKPEPQRRGCPVCKKEDFTGNIIYGVATFTCRACGNQWQGGIGQEPADPRIPSPPQDPKSRPAVEFQLDKKQFGDTPQPYTARRPDPTPDFRKGAPIPSGEDDV